jgi:hypothetical protein
MGAFDFIEDAVNSGGRAIGGAIDCLSSASGSFSNLLDKVPVVGPAFSGVYDFTYGANISFAKSVSDGNRIDKAAAEGLKKKVKGVQKVAPYAQTVISFIPGVGNTASGIIGCGLALAGGQPINEAIVVGIRDSLPGGPAVRIAFDASRAALEGKSIDEIAIDSLPISVEGRKSIKLGIALTVDAAKGKNITSALFNAMVPKDYQKAVAIGMSVGFGQKVQKSTIKKTPISLFGKLSEKGLFISKTNLALNEGIKGVNEDEKNGYLTALGLLSHVVKPIDVIAIRSNLNDKAKVGFDKGVAVHVGAVFTVPPRKIETPEQLYAYWTSKGLINASESLDRALMSKFSAPARTYAVAVAKNETVAAKSWWNKVLAWLGF